jgi:plasmid maintenance system antidote protein VapI
MRSPRTHHPFPEVHLPTPERPRHYTTRAHTYAWLHVFAGGTVPCLSLHGHWLEKAGFKIGASASVEATPGKLIISLLEYPESSREWNPKNFERHIEKVGRPIPGSDVVHEHPGRLVREHILAPMGASTLDFAHAIGVSQDFAECFLAGDQDVDLDLAQRLAPFTSVERWFWWELQQRHNALR